MADSVFFLAVARSHAWEFHLFGHRIAFAWGWHPIIALVAGLLILIRPKLLNFIVAIYLILVGVMGFVQF